MRRMAWTAWMVTAAVVVIGSAPVGLAQDAKVSVRGGQPAANADAKGILKAARSAILTTRTVIYNARCEATGVTASSFPTYNAVVGIQRMITGAPVMAKVSIRGESKRSNGAERTIHFIYDGETMRWLDADGKVEEAEPGEGHAALLAREELILVPQDLLLEEPLTHLIDGGTASHEGRTSVEGTECDIVLVEYTPKAPAGAKPVKTRWFVAVDDHLPRKIEYPTKVEASDGRVIGDASVVLTLAQMQPNARLEPSMFKLTGGVKPAKTKAPPPAPLRPRNSLLAVGDTAPDWVLPTVEGKEWRLGDTRGKVVVLDFWATWCPPCREVMPEIEALHNEYKDRGVVVTGVSTFERRDPVKGPDEYMKKNGFTYGLLVRGDQVAKAYGVQAIPTLYVIGTDGRVAYRKTGAGDMQGLRDAINRQLSKK